MSEKGESICPETFLGAANKFRGVFVQVLSHFPHTSCILQHRAPHIAQVPAMQAKQCLYGHPRMFVKFEIRSCHDLEPEGTT